MGGCEEARNFSEETRILFFGTGTNLSGTVTNTNPISGNPAFVNPAVDDYHLTVASAAINMGTTPNPEVARDIDGQPRPYGGGYDIGYDESPYPLTVYQLYLAFIRK